MAKSRSTKDLQILLCARARAGRAATAEAARVVSERYLFSAEYSIDNTIRREYRCPTVSDTIIGRGGPNDRNSIELSTKRGSRIPNERRLERAPQALKVGAENFKEQHPDAKLRSLTATYDCMGMVFAARRTWVGTESLEMILREDGYRRISEEEVVVGDVIVYRKAGEALHVAVIIDIEIDPMEASRSFRVLSKWGGDGEYDHEMTDVPELLGAPQEFYSERVTFDG